MRSPETTAPTKEIEKNKKASGFNFGFLEVLKNPLGIFEKKVKLWSSKRYVEAALLSRHNLEEARPKILNELRPDLKSFLDEYAALLPVVKYEYGPQGMKNGYSQSMTQIAQHHLQEQELKGLATNRAIMEVNVAQTIEEWMQAPDLAIGAKIVGVSPRGAQEEGYPGTNEKNYIFINVFEKTESGFLFQQYRSYDTLNQTFQLQDSLQKKLGGARKYATNVPQQRPDLHAIASLITLEPDVPLTALEPFIYAHKSSWAVDIDTELPKLDWAAYSSISERTVEFCLEQFVILTNNPDFSAQATDHYTLLINTVKESLIKWVETHALNYESKQSGHTMDFAQILNVWQTRCDQADGKKLDATQKDALNMFKLNTALDPSLPLKKLSSWAHCITGSPASIANQMMKMRSAEFSNVLLTGQITREQLEELIGKERADKWHEGKCITCSFKGLVGECDMCIMCELDPERRARGMKTMSSIEEKFLDSLGAGNKNEGKELFSKFSELALRKTVSFEQLIHNDFTNPEAVKNEELKPYMDRLLFAHNPIEVLREIVSDLSTEKDDKEQKKYDMPIDNKTAAAA